MRDRSRRGAGGVVGHWWRWRRSGRGLRAVGVGRALVVFVCVGPVEGGGASRWAPTPDVSVSESQAAESQVVGQQLGAGGVRTLKATRRRGVEPT